ncbi:MAG TPA: hypothetical protein VK622_02510, partial [Puia sp.]|nr:hypothetical protein [Puia sp.]
VFRKLFFIIPDSRDAGEDFFKQEELNDKLEKHCNLFINTPVDMINIPSALQWSYFAKKIIPSRNVKELAINDFFIGDQKQFSILDFIYQVCDKVKVERFQVENAILNY